MGAPVVAFCRISDAEIRTREPVLHPDAVVIGDPTLLHLGDLAEQAASATADRLNSWYFSDAPASVQPELEPARRATTFDQVMGGLNPHNALFEARRCLSCGNCFECDNCFGVCPDNAVIKLGPGKRYRLDYDFCKGCGPCAVECPCGAIDMVPEET